MPRTLVIQLGRLGDVVQTTPLLGELAAAGNIVDVLVLRSTHVALLGFSAVAKIITIPDSLTSLDDAIACGFPRGEIPAEAHELLCDLQLPLYDRVVNASHAPMGCWLAAQIACANPDARHGGVILDRECLYLGAASAYRVALLQFRERNLINVVDLVRAIPGIAPPRATPRLYVNQAAELSLALPIGRRVALNPGASESARCWPAENFARLAEALTNAGFVVLLVGAPADSELCEKIGGSGRIALPNFAGRTSISELAAVLARCDLLVSADTGAAHIAAAVGTPVLGLYGATAWFAETAPYGDKHLVLQTPLNAPMSAISLNSVVAGALNRLGHFSITEIRGELQREKQFAWETLVDPSSSNDLLGGLSYSPIHENAPTHGDVFARGLRTALATEFLSREMSIEVEVGRIETSAVQSRCESLAGILDRMRAVADFCADSIKRGTSSEKIQSAAAELIAVTEKIRALSHDSAWNPLRPVIHNLEWQLRMLPQEDPVSTFRAHARVYASAGRVLRGAKPVR